MTTLRQSCLVVSAQLSKACSTLSEEPAVVGGVLQSGVNNGTPDSLGSKQGVGCDC